VHNVKRNMSLPLVEETRYLPEPEAYGAALEKRQHTAIESSSKGGSVSHIRINPERNGYLVPGDSHLSFTVQGDLVGLGLPLNQDRPASGASPVLPQASNNPFLRMSPVGAASCIQTIELLNNGSTVSIIDNYQRLAALIMVSDTDVSALNSKHLCERSAYTNARGDLLVGTRVVDFGPCTGQDNTSFDTAGTKCKTPLITCTLPLLGLLSSMSPLPLGQLNHALEIRITWASTPPGLIDTVFYTGTKAGAVGAETNKISTCVLTFTNVYYESTIYRVEDSAEKEIAMLNNYGSEPIKWSVEDYRLAPINYEKLYFNSDSSSIVQVPAMRFNSLKNILLGAFQSNNYGAGTSGLLPFIPFDSVALRLGGIRYPNDELKTLPEVAVSTAAIFSNISSSVPSVLFREGFSKMNERIGDVASTPVGQTDEQKIAISKRLTCGISFEPFPSVEAVNGINSEGMNLELLTTTLNQAGAAATQRCRVFVAGCYDAICVIDQGVLSMSY
jgi:hypothetical protein